MPKRSASKSIEDKVFELGKNKKVTVRSYNGRTLVDIREFYEADGEQRPGKKGISLTVDAWKELVSNLSDIEKAVAEHENPEPESSPPKKTAKKILSEEIVKDEDDN